MIITDLGTKNNNNNNSQNITISAKHTPLKKLIHSIRRVMILKILLFNVLLGFICMLMLIFIWQLNAKRDQHNTQDLGQHRMISHKKRDK